MVPFDGAGRRSTELGCAAAGEEVTSLQRTPGGCERGPSSAVRAPAAAVHDKLLRRAGSLLPRAAGPGSRCELHRLQRSLRRPAGLHLRVQLGSKWFVLTCFFGKLSSSGTHKFKGQLLLSIHIRSSKMARMIFCCNFV